MNTFELKSNPRESIWFANTILTEEEHRNNHCLHLTANENIISQFVQRAISSPLGNRYHLGVHDDYKFNNIVDKDGFIFRGLPGLYRLEFIANEMLKQLLGGQETDFRPLSGVHAMICTIAALTSLGDTVVSLDPYCSGHFATSKQVQMMGRNSVLLKHSLDDFTPCLDHLRQVCSEQTVKMLFLDDNIALYPMPIKAIREIVGPDVIIVYDASHTLGLIMGGSFGDPIADGCDIVQGNTHKTFPGPQKALIHYASQALATKANTVISSGIVSSQHTHHSIALYLTVMEMYQYGESYSAMIVENSRTLATALQNSGFNVLTDVHSDLPETHQVFIRLPKHMTKKDAYERLFSANISSNAKTIMGQDFLRLGVQEVTRLGMTSAQMNQIASIIEKLLILNIPEGELAQEIRCLKENFKTVQYSFDHSIDKVKLDTEEVALLVEDSLPI